MSPASAIATESDVRVFCPLRYEAQRVRRSLGAAASVAVIGPGRGRPELIAGARGALRVLVGVGGGLSERAEPGSAFVARDVSRSQGPHWVCEAARDPRLAGIDAHTAAIVTVDSPVGSPEAKRELAAHTGADVVDMESAWFVERCEADGAAWMVVRGVSDGPTDVLPGAMARWVDAGGGTRLSAILASLVRRPSLARDAVRVARDSARAMDAAAGLLGAVIEAWRRGPPTGGGP